MARAAPVELGMMDRAAARMRRRSGFPERDTVAMSWSCWSDVYAWSVVMSPCSRPNRSCSSLDMGARQLVVQEALEMTVCWEASNTSSFTPMQIMASESPDGAEMMTRLAPPCRCAAALSRAVKMPVDSMTTSTPCSPHGISAGSFDSSLRTSFPSTENPLSVTLTSFFSRPPTESCLRRNAIVSLSPNGSLTATSSTPAPAPRARMAR